MSAKFLENIVKHKRELLKKKAAYYASLERKVSQAPLKIGDRHSTCACPLSFKKSISRKGQINLIAEIKQASPSKGIIRENFDVLKIAQIYVESNVAAISVLTEEKYFLGRPEFIKEIHSRFVIPLLTKDFIISKEQIYEAALNGASAVLLIVAILDDVPLKNLIKVAASLGLDALVEVHDEKELKRALRAGAEIIGVNNRDLKTFKVDLGVCERLIPKIPKGIIIVAESGIVNYKDIERLKKFGTHAVLIGEALMKEKDIAKKIKDVMNG